MEQLSFSEKPDEKLFFLGALAGFAKMGVAKAAVSGAKKTAAPILSKPNIPVKISTGDINTGNNQQEN
jgi:enoyl-[acyl-carrier-protein] reductase (NADH)